MDTLVWIIIALIVVGGAVALIVVGSRTPDQDDDPLAARLAEYSQRGEVTSLEAIELEQPFVDRVIYPMLRKIGELSTRFTPQRVMETVAMRLELAGNPMRMDASTFMAATLLMGPVMAVIVYLASLNIWISLGFGVLGFTIPYMLVTSKMQRRQKEIRKAMPDALDLLTICVEAGLGFDAAMSKVSEKWDNELSVAFARAIREIQLGKTRREALKTMSDRIGLPEMTSFTAAIIQSEQLGVSMARVLRIQSEQMRMKRRQRAEEEAQKAPLKMIIPMGLLIFPSLLIILLTPAGLIFVRLFADFM